MRILRLALILCSGAWLALDASAGWTSNRCGELRPAESCVEEILSAVSGSGRLVFDDARPFAVGTVGRAGSGYLLLDPPSIKVRSVDAPETADRENIPPADLVAARGRWGNEAQVAALGRGHPSPGATFSIAIIGDAEPGRFAWERIFSPAKDAFRRQLRSIQARNPDLILQLGDFVSKGTAANYRAHVRLLEHELRLPMLTVIGNHDRSSPNGRADKAMYEALYGKLDFYCDYNGWRLIGLDTSDRRLTAAQIDWLRGVLNTNLRKIIFTHVPPAYLRRQLQPQEADYLDDGRVRDEGYLRDIFTAYFEDGSVEFGDLVTRARVDRVYMGHIHAFGVSVYKNVPHILSGGGGSPLYPLPTGYPVRKMAHFILAELGPEGVVDETVVPLDGSEFKIRHPESLAALR